MTKPDECFGDPVVEDVPQKLVASNYVRSVMRRVGVAIEEGMHGEHGLPPARDAIRRDGRVRFDHLLMSRNEVELQRRVDVLVKTIEKEIELANNPNAQQQLKKTKSKKN